MCRNQDVAGSALEKREALFKAFQQIRVCRELEARRGSWRKAVRIDHFEAAVPFARFPRPTCSPKGVALREMRGERNVANPKHFAVSEDCNELDFGDWRKNAKLRIVLPYSALAEHWCAPLARSYSRVTPSLQLRDSAGVIEVYMGIENKLYIFNSESQTPDVVSDLLCGFGKRTVNKNVARRRGDKDCRQPVRAYVIGVAINLERFLRRIPNLAGCAVGFAVLGTKR